MVRTLNTDRPLRRGPLGHPSDRRFCSPRRIAVSVSVVVALMVTAARANESAGGETAGESVTKSDLTINSGPLPEGLRPYFRIPERWVDDRGDYQSPLIFADGSLAKTPADWQRRRAEILDQWHGEMGRWPAPIDDPRLEVVGRTRRDGYEERSIRLQWAPHESTQGYLLVPDGEGPFPAVITVYYEPESAIGRGAELRDFALQLTRRGFVTLSLGTTEATAAKTYGIYHPSLEDAAVEPLSMLAYAATTARRALAAEPAVDAARIGITGHSFGGKWAMFASCLDDRFACAAWSDPGIVFQQDRPSINYWEPWYLGYHRQPWRRRGLVTPDNPAHGSYPELLSQKRDLHELHALMAPRPFLVSGGSEDPESRWAPLGHTVAINRLLGVENRVGMSNRPDHSPNPESNAVIYDFFEHFIGD